MTSAGQDDARRVFVSYAHSDHELVQRITHTLEQAGLRVWADNWASPGTDLASWLRESIQASDVVVALLTPAAVASQWVEKEIGFALSRDLDRRGAEFIAVLAEHTTVPLALRDRSVVDLTDDVGAGLRQLVKQIQATTRVDFSSLSPRSFEALVIDLLRTVGFSSTSTRFQQDAGIDLRATYERTDPFGVPETEVWLVEAKLYSHQRVSVDAIRQLAGALATANGATRGLLVTNTQPTSVALEYITELDRSPNVRIRVLDGVELRRLLRQFPEVAARHFGSDNAEGEG